MLQNAKENFSYYTASDFENTLFFREKTTLVIKFNPKPTSLSLSKSVFKLFLTNHFDLSHIFLIATTNAIPGLFNKNMPNHSIHSNVSIISFFQEIIFTTAKKKKMGIEHLHIV
jgi:hypothetical protein